MGRTIKLLDFIGKCHISLSGKIKKSDQLNQQYVCCAAGDDQSYTKLKKTCLFLPVFSVQCFLTFSLNDPNLMTDLLQIMGGNQFLVL